MSSLETSRRLSPPSPWVTRFAATLPSGATALDVACGGGRHLRWLAARGYLVTGVDCDLSGVADLSGVSGVTLIAADLEDGSPWPLPATRCFAAVIVTNYLHRPLFPLLVEALAPEGLLIYETFSAGNAQYGRPANPDFLLRPGELLEIARSHNLQVAAYECGFIDSPKPAVAQRICAARGETPTPL